MCALLVCVLHLPREIISVVQPHVMRAGLSGILYVVQSVQTIPESGSKAGHSRSSQRLLQLDGRHMWRQQQRTKMHSRKMRWP